jgi:mannitol-1-phosphate/altronate dehydrogenase
MKLSLLNATHSAMAYLGRLANLERVDETMQHPTIQRFLNDMMAKEVAPILPPVPDVNLDDYRQKLVERFSNTAIGDRLSRLELNGSAKLPKFLFPSLRKQLAAGGPIEHMTMAIAAWCRYLNGTDEKNAPIAIDDPLKDDLMAAAQKGGADPTSLLALESVFGSDLPKNPRFTAQLAKDLARIYEVGVEQALQEVNERA